MGDLGLIPGWGQFLGCENGNPLQYFCLENSMDREAWRAIVHGVTKSQTRLGDRACRAETNTTLQSNYIPIKNKIMATFPELYPCSLFVFYVIVCTS